MYSNRNTLIDEEIRRYREFQKADPALMGLEIIAIEDMVTPASHARRLGLANVQTFDEYSTTYARQPGGNREGGHAAFLAYNHQRSNEITAQWDRTDNAAGAVNLTDRGTFLGVKWEGRCWGREREGQNRKI